MTCGEAAKLQGSGRGIVRDPVGAKLHCRVLAAEQGVGVALVPARLSADRFLAGGLVKLFEAELTTNESYCPLHRPEDEEREDLQELTQWILSKCRVA